MLGYRGRMEGVATHAISASYARALCGHGVLSCKTSVGGHQPGSSRWHFSRLEENGSPARWRSCDADRAGIQDLAVLGTKSGSRDQPRRIAEGSLGIPELSFHPDRGQLYSQTSPETGARYRQTGTLPGGARDGLQVRPLRFSCFRAEQVQS